MAKAKEQISCSNCGQAWHGQTACKAAKQAARDKFTRGPWNVSSAGIVYHSDTDANLNNAIEIAFVAQMSDGVSEAEANGHLIAAAVNGCFAVNSNDPLTVAVAIPELVNALKALFTWAATHHDADFEGSGESQRMNPDWAKARTLVHRIEAQS